MAEKSEKKVLKDKTETLANANPEQVVSETFAAKTIASAITNPDTLTPAIVLRLQASHGNQFVNRLLNTAPARHPIQRAEEPDQQDLEEYLPEEVAEKVTSQGDGSEKPDEDQTKKAVTEVDPAERDAKMRELAPEMQVDQAPIEEQQEQVEAVAEKTAEHAEPAAPDAEAPPPEKTAAPAPETDGAVQMAADASDIAKQAAELPPIEMPESPPPVQMPAPIVPVDAGGAPLPVDAGGDLLAANVAERINVLRQQGQRLRSGAKQAKSSAKLAEGTLAEAKQTVAQSESGVEKMAKETASRKELVGKAESALQVSEEKAEMVASKAPELVAKADEGKEKSGPMSEEAQELSSDSSGNVPDDPEAGGKMREQGQKLDKVSSDASSIDEAIDEGKSKASQLGEEAAQAKQKNTQTKGQIEGAKSSLEKIESKVDELREQNTASKSELQAFASKPGEISGQADTLDEEGQALIDASMEMETMLQEAQTGYLTGMQSVPAVPEGGGNGAVQRTPDHGLIQRGGYEDRGSVINVGAMGWAFTGDFSTEEERRTSQAREMQRRRDQLARINQMGDGNFARASAGDKMLMSLSLMGENLFGGISDITLTDVGKFMGKIALAFVNPLMAIGGVVAGINMVLTGGANLFSAQQWKNDPLGNLLKSAADIATGLTIILGSISALAGVIMLLMAALVLITLGAATPIAAAVVPICTTVLSSTLPWTIAVGKVALVLQALVFIKNLVDAATASTAEELQQNAEQMSDDVKNAAGVALAIGGAKLGQRTLPQQQAWANSLKAQAAAMRNPPPIPPDAPDLPPVPVDTPDAPPVPADMPDTPTTTPGSTRPGAPVDTPDAPPAPVDTPEGPTPTTGPKPTGDTPDAPTNVPPPTSRPAFREPTPSRHRASAIRSKSWTKGNNTVAADWDMVRADIEAINNGQATQNGNRFTINGRVYETDGKPGHIYPVEGPGLYRLTRQQFQILGKLNSDGEAAARAFASHLPGITQAEIDEVFNLWRASK